MNNHINLGVGSIASANPAASQPQFNFKGAVQDARESNLHVGALRLTFAGVIRNAAGGPALDGRDFYRIIAALTLRMDSFLPLINGLPGDVLLRLIAALNGGLYADLMAGANFVPANGGMMAVDTTVRVTLTIPFQFDSEGDRKNRLWPLAAFIASGLLQFTCRTPVAAWGASFSLPSDMAVSCDVIPQDQDEIYVGTRFEWGFYPGQPGAVAMAQQIELAWYTVLGMAASALGGGFDHRGVTSFGDSGAAYAVALAKQSGVQFRDNWQTHHPISRFDPNFHNAIIESNFLPIVIPSSHGELSQAALDALKVQPNIVIATGAITEGPNIVFERMHPVTDAMVANIKGQVTGAAYKGGTTLQARTMRGRVQEYYRPLVPSKLLPGKKDNRVRPNITAALT